MSVTPTAFEQAMLEYVNLARMDPGGEFDRIIADAETATGQQANITSAISYFGVDLDAFRTQMEAYDAVAPLAWNAALATSAEDHTALMAQTNTQSHQISGEESLGTRITEAGYSNWSNIGENIYAYVDDPLYGHAGFMIDWGYDDADFEGGSLISDWQTVGDGIQDAAGHRVIIMSSAFTEIGIGVQAETDSTTSVGPYVLTQNFGATLTTSPAMLLGVFIDDADGDLSYDIGEGMGGVTVTASSAEGTFTTTTWGSGGYQMELAAGDYTVQFSGADLVGSASYEVTVGTENVKIDGTTDDLRTEEAPLSNVLSGEGTSGADLLEGSGTSSDVLSGLAGDDILMGDGVVAAYFSDTAAQVYRLYQTTLGREPDTAGHENWTSRIAVEGIDALTVVEGFTGSAEFQESYGELSNADFVELLYANVLDRAGDANGLARWTGDLDDGMGRAEVVLGFSDSVEFIASTAAAATTFTNDSSASLWSDDVYRLYQATLGREPDLTGFTNWSERLSEGMSYEEVADRFVLSDEFVATYDTLDNSAFVELLYTNVLERAPDSRGLASWTTQLEAGATRAQVVEGFAQSAEFVASTDSNVTEWIRAQGTDDVITGGSGDDVLAGGTFSDTFVFEPVVGNDIILDFEAWDTLDLTAMGYTSDEVALEHFNQQGDDVVFDNGADTIVTLLNIELSVLSDEVFLI